MKHQLIPTRLLRRERNSPMSLHLRQFLCLPLPPWRIPHLVLLSRNRLPRTATSRRALRSKSLLLRLTTRLLVLRLKNLLLKSTMFRPAHRLWTLPPKSMSWHLRNLLRIPTADPPPRRRLHPPSVMSSDRVVFIRVPTPPPPRRAREVRRPTRSLLRPRLHPFRELLNYAGQERLQKVRGHPLETMRTGVGLHLLLLPRRPHRDECRLRRGPPVSLAD